MQGLKAALPTAVPNTGTPAPSSGSIPPNYMGPDQGPFECDNCKYFIAPQNCSKPEVLQEVGDADGDGYADVDPKGCCNLFESSSAATTQGTQPTTPVQSS